MGNGKMINVMEEEFTNSQMVYHMMASGRTIRKVEKES